MTKRRRSKKTGRFIRSRRRTSTKRKSRRRGGRRTESWKGKRVRVRRNRKGQFITWHKVRRYTRGKTARQKWGTTVRTRAWTSRGKRVGGNHVSAYSTADGESKRVQMSGSGQSLYRAMQLVSQHPPKKQFLTVSPEALLNDPTEYLDLRKHWDARPKIES